MFTAKALYSSFSNWASPCFLRSSRALEFLFSSHSHFQYQVTVASDCWQQIYAEAVVGAGFRLLYLLGGAGVDELFSVSVY